MTRLFCVLAGATVCGALAGCGASSSAHRSRDDLLDRPGPPTVQRLELRTLPGIGPVLTDGAGLSLYMFPPDAHAAVRCTEPCAGTWPTFALRDGGRVDGGQGVRPRLIATVADPTSGQRVVTYAGQPLYHYSGDLRPGQSRGQGLFSDGGPWYLVAASGRPVVEPSTRGIR